MTATSPALIAPVSPAAVSPGSGRPRTTAWPYAGIVSALAVGVADVLMTQGPTAPGVTTWASTDAVVADLSSASSVRLGAGLDLLGLVTAAVFLLGLTRFVARHAPLRGGLVEGMRRASTAFLATGSLGVAIRYIAAGAVPGGVDVPMYTREATATMAVLSDQLTTAAYLPVLAVMGLLGVAAVRDRVLAPAVGAVALLLTATSLGMTVVLGLPYSSALVYPLFALLVGAAGVLTRRAA